MPGNRPTHRPAAGVLLLALLLVGLLIPAVSAQTENISEFEDITLMYTQNHGNIGEDIYSNLVMVVSPIETFKTSQLKAVEYNGYWRDTDTPYTYLISSSALREHQSYAWDDIPLKVGSTVVGSGTLGYYRYGSGLQYVHVYLHVDEFNPGSLTGTQKIKFDFSGYDYSMEQVQVGLALPQYVTVNPTSPKVHFATDFNNPNPGFLGEQLSGSGNNFAVIWNEWKCNYEYDTENVAIDGFANLYITRTVDGKPYTSKVTVIGADGTVLFDNTGSTDLSIVSSPPIYQPLNLTIKNPATGTIYNRILGGAGGPDDPTPPPTTDPSTAKVILYVKNSQTGALISGVQAVVSAGFYDPAELIEVSNTTLAGGTKTYTLQPNGGGLPNPDYYRVSVTADGYNAEMPYADITLDAGIPMTMVLGMQPTGGGPEDDNKTFIEFYVRDMVSNPISGATVTCGPYTLITNSAGYTQFEMPVNATYPYTVSKSGYVNIEGRATVADGPRYVVNVVLGPKEIPTNPPATDPGGPGATPTPDRRTNEQKGQAVIDMIADNAEGIGALALICLLLGLLKLMVKW